MKNQIKVGIFLALGVYFSSIAMQQPQGGGSHIDQATQHYLDQQLIQAASKGAFEEVKRLVGQGADINAIDTDNSSNTEGMTVLGAAVYQAGYGSPQKALEIARYLVDQGADVNKQGRRDSKSPLRLAVYFDDLPLIRYLVEKGADVDSFDQETETTPLIEALLIDYPNFEVVKYLVENGADVNAQNKSGRTPIIDAALSGDPEIVKYLISHGAVVNVKDNNNATPFSEAGRMNSNPKKSFEILKILYAFMNPKPSLEEINNIYTNDRMEGRDELAIEKIRQWFREAEWLNISPYTQQEENEIRELAKARKINLAKKEVERRNKQALKTTLFKRIPSQSGDIGITGKVRKREGDNEGRSVKRIKYS